jgi:hypothetical protein
MLSPSERQYGTSTGIVSINIAKNDRSAAMGMFRESGIEKSIN